MSWESKSKRPPLLFNEEGKAYLRDNKIFLISVFGIIVGFMLYLLCCFALDKIKHATTPDSGVQAQPENLVVTPMLHPVPTFIKGFFIGMTVPQLQNAVNRLGPTWKCDPTRDARQINVLNTDLEAKRDRLTGDAAANFDDSAIVWFDSAGKAIEFVFGPQCSQALFKSQDLTDREFAEMFAESYHLGNMEPTVTEKGLSCWEHLGTDDIRIRIFNEKSFDVSKVTDRDEIKKNFD